MCGSYFYRQHILRVQFFGVIKWPVLCVPGIPLTAFWANAVKKAHKTSKLFNLRGFQVSLSELFHIAFCYFPFRFLPSPYKTPQNQKNKETTKHTKIPSKKYETLILKTFRVDPKRLHERGMCWDLFITGQQSCMAAMCASYTTSPETRRHHHMTQNYIRAIVTTHPQNYIRAIVTTHPGTHPLKNERNIKKQSTPNWTAPYLNILKPS